MKEKWGQGQLCLPPSKDAKLKGGVPGARERQNDIFPAPLPSSQSSCTTFFSRKPSLTPELVQVVPWCSHPLGHPPHPSLAHSGSSLPGDGSDSPTTWASLVAQMVQNPSAIQETRVQSLGWEGPLEEEMATHSSILAWRIPWTEEPDWLQSMGSQRVRHN